MHVPLPFTPRIHLATANDEDDDDSFLLLPLMPN